MDQNGMAGKIAFGEDRFSDPSYFLNGRFDCKVSTRDTDGAMCIFDTFRDACGGPPLHYHELQDEWFMVLDGEFLFQVGETRYLLRSGDSILAPRRTPHAFLNLVEKSRLLIVFTPALRMEEFFKSGIRLHEADSERFEALHNEHATVNIGPPLRAEQALGLSHASARSLA